MGMYYMVTVGVGFEVPLEAIQELGNYEENGESAYETLEDLLYPEYPALSFTSSHFWDASDEETQFAIAVKRLTTNYDQNEIFELVLLDAATPELTDDEWLQLREIQIILGIEKPVVQFVASSIS